MGLFHLVAYGLSTEENQALAPDLGGNGRRDTGRAGADNGNVVALHRSSLRLYQFIFFYIGLFYTDEDDKDHLKDNIVSLR